MHIKTSLIASIVCLYASNALAQEQGVNYSIDYVTPASTSQSTAVSIAPAQPANITISTPAPKQNATQNFSISSAPSSKTEPKVDIKVQSIQKAPVDTKMVEPKVAVTPTQGNNEVIQEQVNSVTSEELINRSYVEDQLYPATNDSRGTDAFAPVNSNSQGFSIESTTQTDPATENANAVANNVVDIQEVSVPILTTLDNAIIDGFKSIENTITLGVGKSTKYDLATIAPAVKGLTTDSDGNAVIKYSMAQVQNILKSQGNATWQGLSNPILIWLVGLDEVGNTNSLSLVSGQNLTAFAQALLNTAPEFKYRVMFPILDLEEIQKVKVQTVLDNDPEILTAASARYGADYFIAAAVNTTSDDGSISFKWNLFNKEGTAVAQSSLTGALDEVVSLGSGDIARALASWQNSEEGKEEDNPEKMTANNVDIERLGPGDGFIRMKIANIRSLQDIQNIRQAFISYGYAGDLRVIGYDNGLMVIEFLTNSDPVILEGTMKRAGDFNYISSWTFSLKENINNRAPMTVNVGPAQKARPNSQVQNLTVTPIVAPDNQEQKEGLPARSQPAIQGNW